MIKDRNIDPNAQIQPSKIAGGVGGLDLFYLASAPRPGADIAGLVYYVHPEWGTDSNDGLAPDRPLKTILQARTLSAGRIDWDGSPDPRWANNDMIILFPGIYDETNLTAGLYGVHVIGLGNSWDLNGEAGVVIKPSSGAVWDAASWINMTLSNVAFLGASGASPLLQLDTFNRGIIQDCMFAGIPGASDTTTKGFETVVDVTGSILRRCFFNQCKSGIWIDVTAPKQFTGCKFSDITIMAADTNGIYVETGSTPSGTVIEDFTIGPTPTKGINDVDGGVMFNRGWVEATANDPATGSGHYNQVYLNGTLQA